MVASIIDSVVWRRKDEPGHDACVLSRIGDGFKVAGTAVFLHKGKPCRFDYEVVCDHRWVTSTAFVRGTIGRSGRTADIQRTAAGWTIDGALREEFADCTDIDLSFTPATNVLPIRRLELKVGAGTEVPAAWLRFPSLRLAKLHQTYKNLGGRRYDYSAFGGRFQRRLRIRPSGLVNDYPGLWSVERAR